MQDSNWLSQIWRWSGFGGKTVWDFVQLLLVPVLVVIVAEKVNDAANARQEREAAEKYQEVIFTEFLKDTTKLLLEERMTDPEADPLAVTAMRARTLTVFRELHGKRKRHVMEFLRECKLINTLRPVVTLAGADLQQTDLSDFYLWGVNLGGTDLRGANLREASLNTAILASADLRNADLSNSNLTGAALWYADLRHANLEGANLQKANLIHARLDDSNLSSVDLKHALYSEETKFPNGFDPMKHDAYAIHPGSNLQKAELGGSYLERVDLANANLSGANLSAAALQGANLSGANLRNANLTGSILFKAILTNADLRNAVLKNAKLKGANLTNAKLQGADMSGATMPDGSIYRKEPD